MSKLLKVVVAIIAILGIVGFVMVAGAEEKTPEMDSAAGFMVNVAYVLLVATVVVAVALSLFSLMKNPAALKKTLLGLVVLGVVLLIAYFTASDAAVYDAQGVLVKDGEAGATSKWVGTGITYSLILGAIGMLFFVWDLLKGLVKS
ncbi:hypothetical protein [uncultured Tenacibaculum sp.]|uniref:hypothetical protein n=1 Tax=uncultured Tenacibaculum sp. TaxID=174713 RepID=UPI0026057B8B|nr:hypothetical protein [uncultured Tenacibaculum sp.]